VQTSHIKQLLLRKQQQRQYRNAVIILTTATIRSKVMKINQPQQ
jgi:hypothetical protein